MRTCSRPAFAPARLISTTAPSSRKSGAAERKLSRMGLREEDNEKTDKPGVDGLDACRWALVIVLRTGMATETHTHHRVIWPGRRCRHHRPNSCGFDAGAIGQAGGGREQAWRGRHHRQ